MGDGYTSDQAITITSAALSEFCPAHRFALNSG
jgi:hypothetical protein